MTTKQHTEAAAPTLTKPITDNTVTPVGGGARPPGRAIVQVALAVLLFLVAVSPPVEELGDTDVRLHHLIHAAIIAAGALLGRLAATWWLQRQARPAPAAPARAVPAPVWWGVVSLGPIVLMAAMVPATSPFVESHLAVHVAEHVALFLAAASIAAAGARLAPSQGWLMTCSLPLMAALFAAIVAPAP